MFPAKKQNLANKTRAYTRTVQLCMNASKALWDSKKGLAEVLVRRGQIWNTTGVNRSSSLFCHIEEVVFLMEQRKMIVTSELNTMTLQDAYDLLTVIEYGCSWDGYLVYAYLKELGYIVKRNGIPWTESRKALEANDQSSRSLDPANNCDGFENSDFNLRLMFDIYPPNGCFKKTCPGLPVFSVSVLRDRPPSLKEILAFENGSKGIPVKFASVVCGHISLFDVNSVDLPELP